MRKKMISLFALLSIALCTLQLCAQDLTWTIKSKKAKELVDKGMFHFQNVERELAYNDFLEALKIEPQCTIAQFMLTGLTVGETKKSYEAMARNSVKDKSEGEKMLVEHMGEYDNAESTRAFWEKMHAQFPDSRLFAYFYATSRKNGEEQFSALQEFNAKYPDVPEAYNIL
ncbi:MAG TPA: hypothetical protein VNS32_16790, partial [Flavisolibacter sp.]|nr:hypothetical protein [Flavisolibacter sp.]